MFSNEIRPAAAVPRIPLGAFESLPRAYWKLRMLIAAFAAFGGMIAAGAVGYLSLWEAVLPVWAGFVAGLMALLVLAWGALVADRGYRRMGFLLREHDLTFQKGWLFRTQVTVPLARIQHSEVHRNPLDRWLGLSTLRIYTAGSSGANLSIPGLKAETANALRSAILQDGAAD